MLKLMACMWAAVLLLPQLAGAQSRPNNSRANYQPVATRKPVAAAEQATIAIPAESGRKEAGAAEAVPGKLPVRRVVLYKNGVGYFEHLGRVRGSQDVTIDFTSGQLNDVLKSLTILYLGKGRITGVSYNSEAPLAEVEDSQRLEDVVELAAGEINGDVLAATHAAQVLEVAHAVLVQHHAAHGQFPRDCLGSSRFFSPRFGRYRYCGLFGSRDGLAGRDRLVVCPAIIGPRLCSGQLREQQRGRPHACHEFVHRCLQESFSEGIAFEPRQGRVSDQEHRDAKSRGFWLRDASLLLA